jgi:hypothetical protein
VGGACYGPCKIKLGHRRINGSNSIRDFSSRRIPTFSPPLPRSNDQFYEPAQPAHVVCQRVLVSRRMAHRCIRQAAAPRSFRFRSSNVAVCLHLATGALRCKSRPLAAADNSLLPLFSSIPHRPPPQPRLVYKDSVFHKQTNATWAREDPAFIITLTAFMLISAVAFGIAFSEPIVEFGFLLLEVVVIHLYLASAACATIAWALASSHLKSGAVSAHATSGAKVGTNSRFSCVASFALVCLP